jgi:hypothetical protein
MLMVWTTIFAIEPAMLLSCLETDVIAPAEQKAREIQGLGGQVSRTAGE